MMTNDSGTDRPCSYDEWQFRLKISAERSVEANRARGLLLDSLQACRIKECSGGSKLYYGELSPGCVSCVQSTMSCCFMNHSCTADCFFCPQDRSRKTEHGPRAEGIVFDDPDAYVEYLQYFGYEGVGFSGGEPLLVINKLLTCIERIKKQFGSRMYVWLYTNGDMAGEDNLRALRDAGLDEIRFNLSARGYDLKPVALACKLLQTVTVEIPVIPEDYDQVRKCLEQMAQSGVTSLNLHQLNVTEHNYRNMTGRNYTILPCVEHGPVIVESERDALRLMKYAAEKKLPLSVHYCSTIYKQRYQNLSLRRAAAVRAKTAVEAISAAGYITSLSVSDVPERIGEIIAACRKKGRADNLWSLTESGTKLFIHPDLLDCIGLCGLNLTLEYSLARIAAVQTTRGKGFMTVAEYLFGRDTRVALLRRLVAREENISLPVVLALLGGGSKTECEELSVELRQDNEETLHRLSAFARIDEGLPDILDYKTYWREIRNLAVRKESQ